MESLPATKVCKKCGVEKHKSEFHRKSASSDKLTTECKACKREYNRRYVAANRVSVREYQARWHIANRDAVIARANKWNNDNRERHLEHCATYFKTPKGLETYLRREYGIGLEQYNDMLQQQDGKCAICGTEAFGAAWSRLGVDHCHDTGKVRGLLCNTCNRVIGMVSESVETLESAALYIRKHKQQPTRTNP